MTTTAIKLVIFDLDGVLVDTEQLHYDALVDAITIKTPLTRTQIKTIVLQDGTSTLQKLGKLQAKYGFKDTTLNDIDDLKQTMTRLSLDIMVRPDEKITTILEHLVINQCQIALASNSRRANVDHILDLMKLRPFFLKIKTPQGFVLPKPHPAMFLLTMMEMGFTPMETLIVEDSESGKTAARLSGAHLLAVDNSADLTLEKIKHATNT